MGPINPKSMLSLVAAAVLIVFSTLLSPSAYSQTNTSFAGSWAILADGKNLIILNVKQNGSKIMGTMSAPEAVMFIGKASVTNVKLPIHVSDITSAKVDGHSLRFDAIRNGRSSSYVLKLTNNDSGQLKIVGAPFDPLPITRVSETSSIATLWDPQATYNLSTDNSELNPEVTEIFLADQRDRQRLYGDKPDNSDRTFEEVRKADLLRRKQIRRLLDANAVNSGDDLEKAAFIFLHGDSREDLMLAHALSLAALGKGYKRAVWISAATFDKLLEIEGKPQLFGTQKTVSKQESSLIPNGLKSMMQIPTDPESSGAVR